MTKTFMPFDWATEEQSSRASRIDDLKRRMPESFMEAANANPHLLEYLSMVPVDQIGLPEYHTKLSKELGDLKNPNVIYPIKDSLFVHIVVDQRDARNCYIPIEPSSTYDVNSLLQQVESACIDYGHELPEFDNDGDKVKQLLHYIDLVTSADELLVSAEEKLKLKLQKKKKHLVKIKATARELEIVKYLFIRDKLGMGELEPLAWDHYIEDISCAGLGPIFIEHKIFKSLKCSINFIEMEDLDNFVLRLAEKIQKPLSLSNPIIDATLESGSRINIVYSSEVSKRGSNFTIRHFATVPISIFDLINFGTLNYLMLAYLSMVISNGMNMFVAGESASGKTSLLNAITAFIHPLSKIITIEDTPELQVPHDNWIREVVQSTRANDNTGAVTTFDLLKAALRQRPNEILVGEIRGPEGNVAFQAMQTGHSVMTTFHAASVEKLIQRITSNPILVPKAYIDNLNVVILMNMVKLRDGKYARRVTGIAEITGYDSLSDSFNVVEVFRWDEMTDKFIFTGYMASYILEYKIAPRLGFSSTKKVKVYDELNKKANILEKLHRDQKITDFYQILSVLGKAQRDGLF